MARTDTSRPDGSTTLLVATTGGHLDELFRISHRIVPATKPTLWVTHDHPQTKSLLRNEETHLVPYVPPRGYRQVAATLPIARRILREGNVDRVISTGAGVALPFFAAAQARRIPCHYIESAARAEGPSLTGRIASKWPGIRLYSQYEHWATGRWNFRGSLFDEFTAEERDDAEIRRVVITLGTMQTYGFRRLIDRLLTVLTEVAPRAELLWQVGVTDAQGVPGEVGASYPNSQLRAAIAQADLVVAHAGIGSALTALELGKKPVLVPRRKAFGEHVDDHQSLIAEELGQRDLAVHAEADQISAADLRLAARGVIKAATNPGLFRLNH